MKVAVWDTYVLRSDGRKMHFDIIVPEELKEAQLIFEYGHHYLQEKFVSNELLTSKECEFCHIENATEQMNKDIELKGFHIIEMENCD